MGRISLSFLDVSDSSLFDEARNISIFIPFFPNNYCFDVSDSSLFDEARNSSIFIPFFPNNYCFRVWHICSDRALIACFLN